MGSMRSSGLCMTPSRSSSRRKGSELVANERRKMELSGDDAIAKWRALIGPTDSNKAREEAPDSVRAKFGTDNQRNAAHGSDSTESAARELAMMFA